MRTREYIYDILLMLVLMLPTGCTESDFEFPQTGSDYYKTSYRIGFTLPGANDVTTRAFTSDVGTINDFCVAVFKNQSNMYILEKFVRYSIGQTAAEVEETATWDNNRKYGEFTIELPETDADRRLHLIANYPDLTMGIGEEGSLIGNLLASDKIDNGEHDVYWNYINIEGTTGGDTGESTGGNTVTQDDAATDGDNEPAAIIPLVRNFTQVQVKVANTVSNFRLTGYGIHNKPKRGKVAPYNSSNGLFANYVTTNGTCQTYDNLENVQGYYGNEPYNNELIPLTSDKFISPGSESNPPMFMYERTHVNTDNPTCLIIKGKYDQNAKFGNDINETYYKLDFIHRDQETSTNVYYNMLRNFIYTMNITSVNGPGYSTLDEAIRKPASNNVSGNTNVDDFTNISNGQSRLFVTTTYLVFTDENPVDIYYKHFPDINNGSINNANTQVNGNGSPIVVTAPYGTDKVLAEVTIAAKDETTGSHAGWRKITLRPNAVSDIVRTQEITIATAHLQRKVVLVLRRPYDMNVNIVEPADRTVYPRTNETVNVKVTIPGGMPSSLFPLKFFVSTADNTLYATPGTDMYCDVINNTYGFVKEIPWNFYNEATSTGVNANGEAVGIKEDDKRISFICNFLTNCANSATTVYVDNEYFAQGYDSFDVEKLTIQRITTESFSNGSVTVQTDTQNSQNMYPRRLQMGTNNTSNSTTSSTPSGGAETVTVKYNGVTVGTITITGSKPNNSSTLNINVTDVNNNSNAKYIEIQDANGLDDSKLSFEFNDYYCTSYSSSYFNRTYYYNSSGTYKASTTFEALTDKSPVLNFTRQ